MTDNKMQHVSVIGAGTQGAMIAFRCAYYGRDVSVYEISGVVRETCQKKIIGWLREFEAKGKILPEQSKAIQEKIKYLESIAECCKNADIVIEAVLEKLELKQQVWAEVDASAPARTILTSNSSSIKASNIFTYTNRKDRTFNLNFSFPIEDDTVEVMWNEQTSEETKKLVKRFLDSIGNNYLITEKEIQGFSFNRIWRVIKKECLYLWANGYSSCETIDRAWMLEFRTPFGPFGLMDKIGLDVVRDIELSYYHETGDEWDKPPQKFIEMCEKGNLGVKTCQGFYNYPNPVYEQHEWLDHNEE